MKPIFLTFAVAILSLLMVACSSNSGKTTAGTNSPAGAADANAGGVGPEACKKSGGRLVRGGVLMFYGCLRPAPDAGKSCTHSNQCAYHCNARPGTRTGQRAAGQCQRNNSYTGCKSEVKDGIVQKPFCIKI